MAIFKLVPAAFFLFLALEIASSLRPFCKRAGLLAMTLLLMLLSIVNSYFLGIWNLVLGAYPFWYLVFGIWCLLFIWFFSCFCVMI